MGVGQAKNRTRPAVERTIPFGLYVYTIVVAWYVLYGYHPADVAEHRARSPWYGSKTTPSFQDMLVKLRRTIIAARLLPTTQVSSRLTKSPTVHLAWAAVAA
ncbi:hypothetical protein ACIBG0_38150 [Nocardia sp. NPDC050630]|uniref:hypothetical protein n=1 Tax=Nocardia sp. NPDC050630 TaxID=3364321 RepID=UPI0037979181